MVLLDIVSGQVLAWLEPTEVLPHRLSCITLTWAASSVWLVAVVGPPLSNAEPYWASDVLDLGFYAHATA